jgi:hypothetical protein
VVDGRGGWWMLLAGFTGGHDGGIINSLR